MNEQKDASFSPAALTAKRFFRNRLAVAGLGILAGMFLFSFLGGLLTPYTQNQVFYREEIQRKEVAAVTRNEQFRLTQKNPERDSLLQAAVTLALGKGEAHFSYEDRSYTLVKKGEDFYEVFSGDTLEGYVSKDIFQGEKAGDFSFSYQALKAYSSGAKAFGAYRIEENGGIFSGQDQIGHISRLLVRSGLQEEIPIAFQGVITEAIEAGQETVTYGGRNFFLEYDLANKIWSVKEKSSTRVWDSYARPSKTHPLGTDKNGMDMLTRLMYGGRVSLVIGFIVVLISAFIGVIFGGVAGYFGGYVDMLVMRLVDIFYCVPTTPLLIILGAAMDALRIDSQIRMLFLMLVLGFLGWPSIARLVRGQILSLREQEFMTAAEAIGLRASRRIFRHLLPNVIPQLVVVCTMSLGSTILLEATLSFLGLGVKFPFASWGNIMNDVSSAHVLTSYWFVWIPAGICLVLAVLGFNFVGDGLRDAFDPKMKR